MYQIAVKSLGTTVFIYVFGDMMGDITINGMVFVGLCSGGSNGFSSLLTFYAKNRASKQAIPVTVEAGGEEVRGFLTALRLRTNVTSQDPVGAYQDFSLRISSLPQR